MMADKPDILLKEVVDNMLNCLEQDREREIISRRFGLEGDKETLEQVGQFLGVTRERIRQLEKAILIHLKIKTEEGNISNMDNLEKLIKRHIIDLGDIAVIDELADLVVGKKATERQRSALIFIAEISDNLIIVDDNDSYNLAIGLANSGDKKIFKEKVDLIVKTIKNKKEPLTIEQLDEILDFDHPKKIEALAKVSKKLASLNELWGLKKWSIVNPKNIKDKIYIILKQVNKPMHYSEIADRIKNSEFKRRNVTKQAIHNELIKDKRFVLIGRGIYALKEWGYSKGTVSEIIARVLQENGPMYQDDIVRQVLKRRKVKETTVLLNLQVRKEFKRVAKSTYEYVEPTTN